MNLDRAEEFIRTHSQAVMATIRRDGRPQLSNVLAVYDEGKLVVSLTETRAKYHNLVRDPRVTLLLLGDSFWEYLSVEGTVNFTHLPDALPLLRRYYERGAGKPHPNWEEYDDAMRNERRVLATVTVERMYPLGD